MKLGRLYNSFPSGQTLQARRSTWSAFLSPEFWAAIFYALLVFGVARQHEPWADEAQAWLLARDSSIWTLWSKLLRLEGTPGLWHTLLHVLIGLDLPYGALNMVSALLGLAAAIVSLRFSPLPLVLRIALPFTYFLCYQYPVIARSYSLAPVILFSLAAVYQRGNRKLGCLTLLLCLLAMVSAHGFLLSVVIAVTLAAQFFTEWRLLDAGSQSKLRRAALVYALVLGVIVWSVWPSRNATFTSALNWSLPNYIGISRYAFQQAFGAGYWPLVIIALSIPLLWRGPGILLFACSSLALCTLGAVVYSNVWHHGFLALIWLFALWISPRAQRPGLPAILALTLFIVLQCSWTFQAVAYDWSSAYSGSRAVANYLKDQHLSQSTIFGIGFPTVAVQPYFGSNLFRNYADPSREASYWLWSKRAAVNDAVERLGSQHPEFVLVGYSNDADRNLWRDLIVRSGYGSIAHFDGETFWQTQAFQPENFELFRPVSKETDSCLLSDLKPAEARTAPQLLWGFHDSAETGRWTGAAFSVSLQRLPNYQASHGSRLIMDFTVPEALLKTRGSLTLVAYVSGHRLPPFAVSHADHYHYNQRVSPADMFWAITPVTFQFSQSGIAFENLPDQNVALVNRIALVTP